MNTVQKFIGHFRTVRRHRAAVRELCFKCGLYWQGVTHDLSKYAPVEFLNGVRFYTGTKSPHSGEREHFGYSRAWLHHKGHNKHHPDYWQDIMPNGKTEPVVMPLKYFAEMLCDRVAASMVYLGDRYTDSAPLQYYMSHRDENQFHPQTRALLEEYLAKIEQEGVDMALGDLEEEISRRRKNNET